MSESEKSSGSVSELESSLGSSLMSSYSSGVSYFSSLMSSYSSGVSYFSSCMCSLTISDSMAGDGSGYVSEGISFTLNNTGECDIIITAIEPNDERPDDAPGYEIDITLPFLLVAGASQGFTGTDAYRSTPATPYKVLNDCEIIYGYFPETGSWNTGDPL